MSNKDLESQEEARRRWAVPPMDGIVDGIDLSYLDPSDPNDRSIIIAAEHPEWKDLLEDPSVHEVVDENGEPFNPRLHLAMHEWLADQLWNNDPPEVWLTAQRLERAGYSRHDVLHMLASVNSAQLWNSLSEQRKYNRDEHLAALDALPGSWEKGVREISRSLRQGTAGLPRSRSQRGRTRRSRKRGRPKRS